MVFVECSAGVLQGWGTRLLKSERLGVLVLVWMLGNGEAASPSTTLMLLFDAKKAENSFGALVPILWAAAQKRLQNAQRGPGTVPQRLNYIASYAIKVLIVGKGWIPLKYTE